MISLLATILDLSYTSKIKLPTSVVRFVEAGLFLISVTIGYLTLEGLCDALIAILDLSAALTIMIFLAMKQKRVK